MGGGAMTCPRCSSQTPKPANFCPFCGHDLRAVEGATTAVMRQPQPEPHRSSTCGRCGASNSPRRVLCARCGADLDSGRTPVARSAVPPGGPDVLERDRGPRLPVVLAVAIVASLAVGALVVVGTAPSNRSGAPPAAAGATFDPQAHPGPPRPLPVRSVEASAAEQQAGRLVDDDPATAWSAPLSVGRRATSDGGGPRIVLTLEDAAWVSALVVRNGDQSDPLAFETTGRVARLLVALGDAAVYDVALDDSAGEQAIELPEPVLAEQVRLRLMAAHPQPGEGPAALSEVTVIGWSAGSG